MSSLEEIINSAFENRDDVTASTEGEIRDAVNNTLDDLDKGKIRVCEKVNNEWIVNQWIKNNEPWAAKFSDADFINYKTEKLANFLKEINENKRT